MVVLVLTEMKLMHGDELRIRYVGELHKAWSGVGHVIKIPDSILGLGFAHTSCLSSSSLSPSPSLGYRAGQPTGWVSGTGFARSLKAWGKWDELFKALKVCEN